MLNSNSETTPKFFGIIVTGPITSIIINEGLEPEGGNEEIGLDNFVI
ncbi:unnamed protein product, partial [marine sediment metagenome]